MHPPEPYIRLMREEWGVCGGFFPFFKHGRILKMSLSLKENGSDYQLATSPMFSHITQNISNYRKLKLISGHVLGLF